MPGGGSVPVGALFSRNAGSSGSGGGWVAGAAAGEGAVVPDDDALLAVVGATDDADDATAGCASDDDCGAGAGMDDGGMTGTGRGTDSGSVDDAAMMRDGDGMAPVTSGGASGTAAMMPWALGTVSPRATASEYGWPAMLDTLATGTPVAPPPATRA